MKYRILGILLLSSTAFSDDITMCAWCEAGDSTCDWSFADYSADLFVTSASASVGGRAFPYFRPTAQPALGVANPNVKIAVIVHHGAARNGENYTSYMTNSVLRAGRSLGDTMVIGPQIYFPGDDGLDEDVHIWWDESSDDGGDANDGARDWKWGGNSTSELDFSISTFQVLDEMLLTLAKKSLYPNLERVVFAGHSAGGQIMQRYALFSRVYSDTAQLEIKYFVGNPSSVTWLGKERPVQASTKECDTFCVNTTIMTQEWVFKEPAESACAASYNNYGYGLEGPLPSYPNTTTVEKAVSQYADRDVVYLSGESDVCDARYMTDEHCTDCVPDDGGLDTSCEAFSQGWCRMSRLHAFSQYVSVFYGTPTHSLLSVPGVGHSGCGMFQSFAFSAAAYL